MFRWCWGNWRYTYSYKHVITFRAATGLQFSTLDSVYNPYWWSLFPLSLFLFFFWKFARTSDSVWFHSKSSGFEDERRSMECPQNYSLSILACICKCVSTFELCICCLCSVDGKRTYYIFITTGVHCVWLISACPPLQPITVPWPSSLTLDSNEPCPSGSRGLDAVLRAPPNLSFTLLDTSVQHGGLASPMVLHLWVWLASLSEF